MTEASTMLELDQVRVEFRRGRKPPVRAVNGVSLSVAEKETLGLVGESGSGKSTIGNAILGLVPVTSGRIRFRDTDLVGLNARGRRSIAKRIQVVFQDPYSSLNPVRTIGQTLSEPLLVHRNMSRSTIRNHVDEALGRVGLPSEVARRYPAQFSGGQRQRVAIARALILEPELVICDEPTSALDLSVQAQILNLLLDLQQNLGLSYLFISHDIDVVRHVSDRVAVLRNGELMEVGTTEAVTESPSHPYTEALLAAVPVPDPSVQAARRAKRLDTRLDEQPSSSVANAM